MKAGHLQAAKIINPTIERVITLGLSPRRATLATREVARQVCRIVDELAPEMGLRRVDGL